MAPGPAWDVSVAMGLMVSSSRSRHSAWTQPMSRWSWLWRSSRTCVRVRAWSGDANRDLRCCAPATTDRWRLTRLAEVEDRKATLTDQTAFVAPQASANGRYIICFDG